MIVKAHGGTLEVSSSAEGGTRFVARIPIRPATDAPAA
jgi:signal transduction histidine kinase